MCKATPTETLLSLHAWDSNIKHKHQFFLTACCVPRVPFTHISTLTLTAATREPCLKSLGADRPHQRIHHQVDFHKKHGSSSTLLHALWHLWPEDEREIGSSLKKNQRAAQVNWWCWQISGQRCHVWRSHSVDLDVYPHPSWPQSHYNLRPRKMTHARGGSVTLVAYCCLWSQIWFVLIMWSSFVSQLEVWRLNVPQTQKNKKIIQAIIDSLCWRGSFPLTFLLTKAFLY